MKVNLDHHFEIVQLLFDMLPYVFWKDRSGIYRGGNMNQAKAFGFNSPADFIGKKIFEIIEDDVTAGLIDKTDNTIMQTGISQVLEEELNTPLGVKIYLSQKHPIIDTSGEIAGLLGFAVDVTEFKKYEVLAKNQQQQFNDFISKMVHDIKSPLISLKNLVQAATELPEAKRITLHSAATTITNIADHMLGRYVDPNSSTDNQCQKVLLSVLLEQLISEKRFEYGINVQFELILKKDTNFAFIKIEPVKFKRMLSNVINNAIDATRFKANPKISISLSGYLADKYVVSVVDNGIGMSAATISKIMEGTKVTQNKANGHGLGMSQVMDVLAQSSGLLIIDSTLGEGATVSLSFPRVSTPLWFTSEVKIAEDSVIVILDDEPSIHGTWDLRLQEITLALPDVKILHFNQGHKVLDYINGLPQNEKQRVCLLSDYELLNEDIHGLEVIQQTGIKRAILITSHYADSKIQLQALEAGVKMLPKSLVPKAIIKLDEKLIPNSRKVDAVWIEDAFLELMDIIKVGYKHLTVDTYEDPVTFLEELEQYPLHTKVIFDYYFYFDYDERVKIMNGLTLAERLHNKGYTDLYLCTAEDIPTDKIPPYLEYVLKTDVLESKNLSVFELM